MAGRNWHLNSRPAPDDLSSSEPQIAGSVARIVAQVDAASAAERAAGFAAYRQALASGQGSPIRREIARRVLAHYGQDVPA